MLKTYITTVPLQGKLDPMLYQRERAEAPTATCFPIVQVMRDTLELGDTVQLLAIRQENADTARNYQRLLEELAQLGIAEDQVRQIDLPEDQRPETLIGLCRDLVDALPQVTRVYACITYGSKSIPVVTLTALTCAEATHTELEVGGVYYGEVKRENGQAGRPGPGRGAFPDPKPTRARANRQGQVYPRGGNRPLQRPGGRLGE